MKIGIVFSFLSMSSLFANISTIEFENCHTQDIKIFQNTLEKVDSDLFVIKNAEFTNPEDLDLGGFHAINTPELPSYTFFSKKKMDHFQVFILDQDNFVIETTSENLPEVLYYGYLPSLNVDQIESLKKSIFENSSNTDKIISGDLILIDPIHNPLFELCANKEASTAEELAVASDLTSDEATTSEELAVTSDLTSDEATTSEELAVISDLTSDEATSCEELAVASDDVITIASVNTKPKAEHPEEEIVKAETQEELC